MIVAVYNLKGGVGKTATAVNLAFHAARTGHRTLLWDLDPQGAATWHFRVEAHLPGGAKRLARAGTDVDSAIRGTDTDNLDLLPADFRLRRLDALLDSAEAGREALVHALAPVARDYDLVLVDCPPSIGRTTEAVLTLVDALVVPVIPAPLSVRTLDQLTAFATERNLRPRWVLPFFTLVDRRKALHQEMLATLPARYPDMLSTAVPYASDVERMSVERRPLATFARNSAADQAYRALWDEIRGRLG
ncbi:MAG: ParA family protein [Myxococcota bacterium]